MLRRVLWLILFLVFCEGAAYAACTGSSPTWTTTPDIASVQACVDGASPGDTINISAGSATWTSPLSWSDKGLTINGATCTGTARPMDGTASTLACTTIITGNAGSASTITANICSASNFVTISNLKMQVLSTGSTYGQININCNHVGGYPPIAFRIHHVQMIGDPTDGSSDASNGPRFIASSDYGLVDHSSFVSSTARGMGNIAMIQDNDFSQSNNYHIPITYGDANALYTENCYFYFATGNQGNGATDNYAGARWVFRFNTVYNNNIGNHGWDSGPRGTRSFEVYGNIFVGESHVAGINLFGPRSGTGPVWGNVVKNIQPMSGGEGYQDFFSPRYYGAITPSAAGGNATINARAGGYYPTLVGGVWGTTPYPGTTGPLNDGYLNVVTGLNPIDGNQVAAGHMDSAYTRTVTDLVTTSGSATVTSATASFVAGDIPKLISGTSIQAARFVSDGNWTSGSPTITSSNANFSAGDVGMYVGTGSFQEADIPRNTKIQSVTNSTTAVLDKNATATGTGHLRLTGPYIVTVNSSTSITLNVKATATGTGGTLTIGYTDQGYPLADQPGWGSFASANAGSWPSSASYSAANFEALEPTYLAANLWQTNNADLTVITSANPAASAVGLNGSQPYIKANREWYDPAGSIQTSTSSPFDGTSGSGTGTLANMPTTCTSGVGYWAVDQGSWNASATTYTYPNGGTAYSQGRLYKCTSTNTWTLNYTPYTYPYPGTGDLTPPVPGNSGTITAASVASTTLTLSWTKATDAVTSQANLVYEVCKSTSNNISTYAQCDAATIIRSFTADINTFAVTGLTPFTLYYFNVVVKDEAGNEAAYTPVSATTLCVPDHLTFTSQPASAVVGATLTTVSVGVYNSGNTLCTDATNTVTLSKNAGATWNALTSGSSLAKAASAGVATWTDLSVTPTIGSGTIDAAATALTGATSNSITISASSGTGAGRLRLR